MERKRLDYWNLVKQYYDTERDEGFQDTYRQIHIDIPRMSPLISLFQQSTVQMIFERILYIWAIRHPASGYVQVYLFVFIFKIFFQKKKLLVQNTLSPCYIFDIEFFHSFKVVPN